MSSCCILCYTGGKKIRLGTFLLIHRVTEAKLRSCILLDYCKVIIDMLAINVKLGPIRHILINFSSRKKTGRILVEGVSGIKIVKSLTETSRNVGNFLSKPRLAKPD